MIIVNLTTTSNRLHLCSATVFSLIQQSLLPEKIIIWVSESGYLSDEGVLSIPEWVNFLNGFLKYKEHVIEVRYTTNTGPYRKIIPALRTFAKDDILVYADDDVIYGEEWLKKIITRFQINNGEFIVAPRVRLIKKNILNINKSYNAYPICFSDSLLEYQYIITGVGGCALSISHVDNVFISMDDYLDVAPTTDDLWISKIIQLSGSKLLVCPEAIIDVQEVWHEKFTLNSINTFRLKNVFPLGLIFKVYYKILSYFGFSISSNDRNLKAINHFFKIKGL
ncbi:glycosyltransferase family 2 protein [Tatumella sp. TA1]|nr:glycosyltransferase family 2 protein [Tatumella sp. TA1]